MLTTNVGRSPVTRPGYRKGMKPANAGQKLPAEVLAEREVLALMAACSSRGKAGVRDRAMIAVLYRTGLRIAELLALAPKDVDLDTRTVTVLLGKGAKRRIVAFDVQTAAIVECWVAVRVRLDVPRGSPLFCTVSRDPRPGRAVRASVWRETLKALGRRAGIEKRVHPHGLRHTFAHELRCAGVDVVTIMKLLGHSSLKTTLIYLDHLSPEAELNVLRGREWSAMSDDGHALPSAA